MSMELIVLIGVSLLVLIGLLTRQVRFERLTERIVTYLMPIKNWQKVFAKHRNAFTLMELLVVITIIVILASILLPTLREARGRAKYARWFGARQNIMTHPKCIAYYDFEGTGDTLKCQETLGVKKPAKLDGTISGATRVKGGGRWPGKGALKFESAHEDYVDCGSNSTLNFGSVTDFTLEAWIKTSTVDTYMTVLTKQSGSVSPYQGYHFHIHNNKLRAAIKDSSTGAVYPTGTTTITDGIWHHVAFVADRDGDCQFYTDGQPDGAAVDMSGVGDIDTDIPLRIGVLHATYYPFNGIIDEVAIYNKALTEEEIKEHYRGGRP